MCVTLFRLTHAVEKASLNRRINILAFSVILDDSVLRSRIFSYVMSVHGGLYSRALEIPGYDLPNETLALSWFLLATKM
jgi:hypothetical protein